MTRLVCRRDGGFVALGVVCTAALLFVAAAAAIIVASDVATTAARARAAADAAALAGMAASPLAGGDGRAHLAAARLAEANDARLVRLGEEGWPLRLAVTTQADPSTLLVRRLTGGLRATAVAALRPASVPVAVDDAVAPRRAIRGGGVAAPEPTDDPGSGAKPSAGVPR
jgi:hypothetical protein